jgi:transcriptional regulator GlxA family with amidase domain
MAIFEASEEKLRVTLLVLPESSMMSLASVLDPMRAANRISGRSLFEWRIATLNNKPAPLTCALAVEADTALDFNSGGDVLIVIASFNQQQHAGPAHLKLIKRIARNFKAIGGIEAGSWILARCGLLKNRAATTHWEDLEEFAAHFPGVDLRPDRYVVDEPVFTTGGASPTFDLILHLIRKRYGYPLAIEVSSVFIYDARQSAAQHVDDTLNIEQVAAQLDLSVRMLEYLFRDTMNLSPAAYYRRLRLQIARRMVVDTRLQLQEIAIRTGFNSLSSFSRQFKNHYQQSPGECRKQALLTP